MLTENDLQEILCSKNRKTQNNVNLQYALIGIKRSICVFMTGEAWSIAKGKSTKNKIKSLVKMINSGEQQNYGSKLVSVLSFVLSSLFIIFWDCFIIWKYCLWIGKKHMCPYVDKVLHMYKDVTVCSMGNSHVFLSLWNNTI